MTLNYTLLLNLFEKKKSNTLIISKYNNEDN